MRKVIQTVDQPAPAQLATIKLRYAAAVDVGQAMQRLVPEARAAGRARARRRASR